MNFLQPVSGLNSLTVSAIALAGAFALNSLIMAACFRFAKRINNFSIVDAVWAFAFVPTVWLYSWLSPVSTGRRLMVLLPVTAWSLRLAIHLAVRIRSHHPKEDGRYLMLRERYLGAKGIDHGFYWFFQYQAWSVVLLSGPFLISLMSRNSSPLAGALEWTGLALWSIGFLGESFADLQMKRFRKWNPGRTCDQGLWRYSRHPNYFFETLIWFGFAGIALSSPLGWVAFYAPLLILYLVLHVTGVPMAEAQSLKSRGEEYRKYQMRTSKFVPWFPKKESKPS